MSSLYLRGYAFSELKWNLHTMLSGKFSFSSKHQESIGSSPEWSPAEKHQFIFCLIFASFDKKGVLHNLQSAKSLVIHLETRQGTKSPHQYCYLDLVIWYYLLAQPIQYKEWGGNAVYLKPFELDSTVSVRVRCMTIWHALVGPPRNKNICHSHVNAPRHPKGGVPIIKMEI